MGWRGSLDIWGNDHYLGHIHRSMRFFTQPTHTVVLGDHMSSQWIDDAEFIKRSDRMEKRVLGVQDTTNVFNITGNHDVGYAGDMTPFRLNRWIHRFGPLNYIRELDMKSIPAESAGLRIVGMNDLLLDGPAYDEDIRGQTHAFLRTLPSTCDKSGRRYVDGKSSSLQTPAGSACFNGATILLTHVPLHKDSGICVDPPHMAYYEQPRIMLREQNYLSQDSSKAVLEGVFGYGDGIILTGHDHEGCHTLHTPPAVSNQYWDTSKFTKSIFEKSRAAHTKSIEEVTVRSVMGQYGGNAGLLTATYDQVLHEWKFHYHAVLFVHNTVWWSIHVTTVLGSIYLVAYYVLSKTISGRKVYAYLHGSYSKLKRY